MTGENPTPYEILGVLPHVTPEELKRAYRAKAKAHHPDHNREPGAEAVFLRIQFAYEILSDPARRARYDATGDASEQQPDNSTAELLTALSSAFNMVMADLMARQQDPRHVDVVNEMMELFLEQERQIEATQFQFAKNRAFLSSMLGRFQVQDGTPNVMEQMIRGQISEIDRSVETNRGALKQARRPRIYLQGCRFRRDPVMGMFAATTT